MCVTCELEYGPCAKPNPRWHWGSPLNFLPKRRRGEGNPAPWFLWHTKNFGIQLELSRSRPWFSPEFYKSTRGSGVYSVMWGFFVVAWRVKCSY